MGRISQISTTVQAILRFVFSQCLPEAADHSGSQRPYGCETKFTSRTKHHVTIISKNYVTKLLCLFDYYKSSSPPRFRHKWLTPLEPSAPHAERPPARACAHSASSSRTNSPSSPAPPAGNPPTHQTHQTASPAPFGIPRLL